MTDLTQRAAALLAAEGPYYAERDYDDMPNDYDRHVNAMTSENLRAKFQIVAELAHRDALIRELLAENERLRSENVKDRTYLIEQECHLRARVAELEGQQSKEHQQMMSGYAGPTPFQGRTTRRD